MSIRPERTWSGDHAHAHVVVLILAVGAAGELFRGANNWDDLVDLVQVRNTLFEERDALESKAGVNVLTLEVSQDGEVVLAAASATFVLHEHEVPNLDVALFVSLGGRPRLQTWGRDR